MFFCNSFYHVPYNVLEPKLQTSHTARPAQLLDIMSQVGFSPYISPVIATPLCFVHARTCLFGLFGCFRLHDQPRLALSFSQIQESTVSCGPDRIARP